MITINPKLLKAIVKQECQSYKSSGSYKKLEGQFDLSEKETINILSVYDNIQQKLLAQEIQQLRKEKSLDEIIDLLALKARDIRFFESELFKLTKSKQLEEDSLNAYYGMVSNENIDLLEMIEKEILESKHF